MLVSALATNFSNSIFPDDSFSLSHSFLLIVFFLSSALPASSAACTHYLSIPHAHTHTRARARARTHTHSEFRIFELFYSLQCRTFVLLNKTLSALSKKKKFQVESTKIGTVRKFVTLLLRRNRRAWFEANFGNAMGENFVLLTTFHSHTFPGPVDSSCSKPTAAFMSTRICFSSSYYFPSFVFSSLISQEHIRRDR